MKKCIHCKEEISKNKRYILLDDYEPSYICEDCTMQMTGYCMIDLLGIAFVKNDD